MLIFLISILVYIFIYLFLIIRVPFLIASTSFRITSCKSKTLNFLLSCLSVIIFPISMFLLYISQEWSDLKWTIKNR